MSQRIITGFLTRSFGVTRRTPKAQWITVRKSSNKPPSISTRKDVAYVPTDSNDEGGKRVKTHYPPSSVLLKLESHQESIRDNVHSALRGDGIEVEKWPWLERLVHASIIQNGTAARECLESICADLQSQNPSSEGIEILEPLYRPLSTESENLVLRIVHKLSSNLPKVPVRVFQVLLARYYRLGLPLYVEQLSSIIERSENLSARDRAVILYVRLKYEKYIDYWEAFEEYRNLRDWCLKQDNQEVFKVNTWYRVVYQLTEARIQDPSSSPSLPIEITLELLADHDKYMQKETINTLKFQCLFLDHYAKKSIRYLSPEWILNHQQIISGIHQALVERYGEDLDSNPVLFTSLLQAYGRVGLPQSAMEVWNTMITSDIGINSIALSVIFDNCGRLNRLSDARRIFAWLEHSEKADELMDKNVWDSWLECLCRCGALREAIHYAFHLMEPALRKRAEILQEEGKGSKLFSRNDEGLSALKPDAKTFNLLLSFSGSTKSRNAYGLRAPSIHAEIVKRINGDYPEASPYIQSHLFSLQS